MKITQEIVRELLHYDPDSGIFTWKARSEKWFKTRRACLLWNARDPGKRAGCVWNNSRTGYQCREINILGTLRAEHRLAWLYMVGEPIPPQIDHVNRVATDNRWKNLRASSNAKNTLNRSRRRDNKSGVTGVTWAADRKKWKAECCVDGVRYRLGSFCTVEEAERALRNIRKQLGFSEGHGKELAHYAK